MDQINALQTQTRGGDAQAIVEGILSRKAPLMSNPGSVVANNLYYDSNSVAVVAAECVSNYGRYSQSLTSLQLGSAGNFTIPNSSFLSGMYVYAELPALPANVFLPRSWLLNSIAQISFILGSSNVSQINISGASHIAQLLLSCETAEKRNEVLRLAGDEVTSAPQAPGTVNRAYMQLQLPWSRINSLMKKLPFDTSLLSSPVIVNIQLKQQADFFTGSGLATAPQAFSRYTVFANQIDLMDKELSLAIPLMRDPGLMYSYPFTYVQTSTQNFVGSASSSSPVSLILTGLVNADLVGISLQIIRSDRLTGGNGSSPLSPLAYERVQNLLLQYNGLTLYDSPGQMYRLYDAQDLPGSGVVPYSVLTAAGAGPYVTTPADAYIQFIPFTRLRNTQFGDMFQNSFRIANNVLNLGFITPENVPYTLTSTYYYNACFGIQQGQSNLIIS